MYGLCVTLKCVSNCSHFLQTHADTLSSPEDDVIIEIIAAANTGHHALRSEAGLYEGPWVKHAQQGVDEHLCYSGRHNTGAGSSHKIGRQASGSSKFQFTGRFVPLCLSVSEGCSDCWADSP